MKCAGGNVRGYGKKTTQVSSSGLGVAKSAMGITTANVQNIKSMLLDFFVEKKKGMMAQNRHQCGKMKNPGVSEIYPNPLPEEICIPNVKFPQLKNDGQSWLQFGGRGA